MELDPNSVVYAIAHGDVIKIGFSTNVSERMKDIGRMSPVSLQLLGTVPGGRQREAALHREFAEWRMHGEWFKLPPEQVELLVQRLQGVPRIINIPSSQRPHPTKGYKTDAYYRRKRANKKKRRRLRENEVSIKVVGDAPKIRQLQNPPRDRKAGLGIIEIPKGLSPSLQPKDDRLVSKENVSRSAGW